VHRHLDRALPRRFNFWGRLKQGGNDPSDGSEEESAQKPRPRFTFRSADKSSDETRNDPEDD